VVPLKLRLSDREDGKRLLWFRREYANRKLDGKKKRNCTNTNSDERGIYITLVFFYAISTLNIPRNSRSSLLLFNIANSRRWLSQNKRVLRHTETRTDSWRTSVDYRLNIALFYVLIFSFGSYIKRCRFRWRLISSSKHRGTDKFSRFNAEQIRAIARGN